MGHGYPACNTPVLFCAQAQDVEWQYAFLYSGMIVASQGLAWALILTFMSQVSPVKLLGNQMAGLTEVGSICCCTHCPCYLLYFLLPVDVIVCVAVSFVQCYLPFYRPFQIWIPFCRSLYAFSLLGTPLSMKAHELAAFLGSFGGFCLNVTFSIHLI